MTKRVGQKFPLSQKEVAQTGAAATEARFDSAQRYVERLRDLLVAEALHVAEDDDGTLVGRERHEARLNVTAQFGAEEALLGRLGFIGQVEGRAVAGHVVERHLGTAPATSQLVGTGVRGNAEQPGAEDAAAIAVDAAVGCQEGVLGNVLGGMAGSEHAQAKAVHDVLVRFHEDVERSEVARPGSRQQRGVVDASLEAIAGQPAPPEFEFVVTILTEERWIRRRRSGLIRTEPGRAVTTASFVPAFTAS